MSEVDRLRDELALAEAAEELEKARAAVHAHESEATTAAYRKASEKVASKRQAYRAKYPRGAAPGDGVATPDPVRISGKAVQP